MKGKLLFLGTGASLGIPVIGCHCEVCTSASSFNRRSRPAALISLFNKKFLIDAGPDFRMQALQYQVTHLDGVLLTHAHQDHTAGIDDLRALCFRKSQPMPVLLSEETAKEIQIRYAYIFQTGHPYEKSAPKMHLYILEHLNGKMDFEKVVIQYVSYFQGGMKVNGFRFGSLAYLTDVCDYSPTIFEQLKGVKTLIISALRYIKSPLHLSVDEAIDFAKRLEVEKAWLTHLSHDLEHERTNAYLPPFIKCAYDGLEIEFDM